MRSFFGRMVYRLAENSNISIGELLFWVSLILILVFIVWGAIVAENMMRRKRAEIEALVDATTAASSKFHEALCESCKSFFELNNYSMESLRKVPAENGIFLYAFVYGIMFGNIAFLLMYRNINDIKTIEEKVSSYDVQEQSTLSTNGFLLSWDFPI